MTEKTPNPYDAPRVEANKIPAKTTASDRVFNLFQQKEEELRSEEVPQPLKDWIQRMETRHYDARQSRKFNLQNIFKIGPHSYRIVYSMLSGDFTGPITKYQHHLECTLDENDVRMIEERTYDVGKLGRKFFRGEVYE